VPLEPQAAPSAATPAPDAAAPASRAPSGTQPPPTTETTPSPPAPVAASTAGGAAETVRHPHTERKRVDRPPRLARDGCERNIFKAPAAGHPTIASQSGWRDLLASLRAQRFARQQTPAGQRLRSRCFPD
jgi:hypothetical protein